MKKLLYVFIGAALFLASCETIENRQTLGPDVTADMIKIDVYGSTEGSNQTVIINNTSEYGGTWDLFGEVSTREVDTILMPFLGTKTFKFTAVTDGGLVEISKDYTVTKMDHPVKPEWGFFAGMYAEGKTWVWAFDNPNCKANGPWGKGAYLQDTYPSWGGPGSTPSAFTDGTAEDEMKFDLNTIANFTLSTKNTSSAGMKAGTYKGEFKFSTFPLDKKYNVVGTDTLAIWCIGNLTLKGTDKPTIINGYSPNEANKKVTKFDIVKISENELVLSYATKDAVKGDEVWFWVFKPKGYNF